MSLVVKCAECTFELANLTSHPIELLTSTGVLLLPSDGFASVECRTERLDDLRCKRVYGEIRGLPALADGDFVPRLYIVSAVLKSRPEVIAREDCVTVGGVERGSHGQPLRARYLVV